MKCMFQSNYKQVFQTCMIDEYVHFNDSARNSIMERMTPDYTLELEAKQNLISTSQK